MSFAASSREQFYVSASRGTQQVTIYTEDKEELLDAVKRSEERLTATELVNGLPPGSVVSLHQRIADMTDRNREQERERQIHER